METASLPTLYTLRFRRRATATHATTAVKFYYHAYTNRLLASSLLAFAGSRLCHSFGRKSKKRLQFDQFVVSSSSRNTTESNPSQKFAVLLEVEGVLMDVYRLCNRQAFNIAFKKLGLDCANWSEPVYIDLVRRSAGDEERMLILFFNRIGWPTSVATSEKDSFMKNVLREKYRTPLVEFRLITLNRLKFVFPEVAQLLVNSLQKNALDDLVMSNSFSLRPGAEEFIDEAYQEGIPVTILTAYSASGEKVARSIVEKLGTDRMSKTKIIGDNEVKQSFYGQLVFGKGVCSSLEEQLAKEVSKAASAEKQRIAEEVASMLKLKVELDTSSSESFQNIVATLRAAAENVEVPIYNCVLVAGSQTGVAAAERIGMPCVVLRSSTTSRAEFRRAIAVMDGFGGADLSISRLRKKLFP